MKIEIEVQDEHEAQAILHVLQERRFQDEKFGVQDHDPAWWMTILGEEYGETCQAVCEYRWGSGSLDHAYKESFQVAAVAVAFMQCLLRNQWRDQITTALPSDRRKLANAMGRGHESINYEDVGPVVQGGKHALRAFAPEEAYVVEQPDPPIAMDSFLDTMFDRDDRDG